MKSSHCNNKLLRKHNSDSAWLFSRYLASSPDAASESSISLVLQIYMAFGICDMHIHGAFAATLKAHIPPKIKSFEDYERVMRYVLVQFHMSHPIKNDLADAQVYLQAGKPQQDKQPTTFCSTSHAKARF